MILWLGSIHIPIIVNRFDGLTIFWRVSHQYLVLVQSEGGWHTNVDDLYSDLFACMNVYILHMVPRVCLNGMELNGMYACMYLDIFNKYTCFLLRV